MWDLIVSVPDHCLSFYLRYVPIELCFNAVRRCRFLSTFSRLYTSSIGTYLQPANQLVKSAITFEPYKIT